MGECRARGWRFGPNVFGMLFGFLLGTGFLTALPSLGFLMLLVAAITVHASPQVVLFFALFAQRASHPSPPYLLFRR
jgi:hypothetical protein